MNKPYTYLIGWSSQQKFYYGVRYAINCDTSDLWSTYFTSSKHVKRFREKFGEPDIIQIRKVFENKTQALLWENKVLQRMNVINDEKWINQTNNRAIVFERTDEWKQNLSKALLGRAPVFKGRKHTEEAKEINRLKHLGIKTGRTSEDFTDEWKQNISNACKGRINRPWTEEEKLHLAIKALERDFGQVTKGRVWINNGVHAIRVYPEQLENYPGYTLGRKLITQQPS